MKALKFRITILACLAAAMPVASFAQADAVSQEVRELRDRAEIEELLRDYGRTIDERDFDAFGRLFTPDGEYGAGPSMTVGPEAIAAGMRAIFESNALGFGEPNFHVFFNTVIDVDGDRASATSMSFYIVPGEDGLPEIALMARYEDELVRTGNGWKFRKRSVEGLMPAPN
ncbi:nuclear transport factor 2 family protein [Aurantiacibacter poecillastricola]|uniref:nuclear transport factor 2 family protein n=1 Tax=Aurantiacibacter poecillastricola TaxID=3064385 RepID=UPI00273EDB2B|nr:nuclear transport factor 2 family protein [Aurantiacibacter sp. 219JJ12-13]MDP5262925.1 nuclear transport factor 2 family protein [Aurantiacibacter sp. 219JJ12-13]